MEPPEHDPITGWDVAKVLWGVVVSMLAGSAAWMNGRLKSLEDSMQTKAVKLDTDQRFRDEKADHDRESARLERLFSEHREETRDQFRAVNARLDTIIERMMR